MAVMQFRSQSGYVSAALRGPCSGPFPGN